LRKGLAVVAIPALTLILMLADRLAVGQLQAGAPQVAAGGAAAGAEGSKSVWDLVYSAAQADAGKIVYEGTCSSCHAADLTGGRARGLRGDAFLRDWGADSLDRLYQRMKTDMPRNAPASLSDEEYLDVVAYILQVNEFPVGTKPLAADQLGQIQVYGKGGPASVPDFALVTVVGCLTQGADNAWTLVNSSAPVMTRDPGQSKDAALTKAEETPSGIQAFLLVEAYPPADPHKGHKVEAKGFLMRTGKATSISITSLQTVKPMCDN
jgi:mono/diheme cytochrome c family protein